MNHIDEFTLNEYLDGELDGATAQAVTAHLDACAACRAELAALELLFARLETVADLSLEKDLGDGVMASLAARPRLSQWTVVLLALQTLVAILLGIWLWPTLQPLWQPVGTAVAPALSPEQWHTWWASLAAWATTLVTRLRAATPPASVNISAQWSIILGLAFVLWLTGNRLLLPRNTHEPGGRHG